MLVPKVPREHQRRRVLWNVKLHQDGRIWGCQVVDISAGGAKVRLTEPLAISSRVVLEIERLGNLKGEVRWQNHAFVGIGFLESPDVVEKRLRSVAMDKGDASYGKRGSSGST